jgi:hypothetical protein
MERETRLVGRRLRWRLSNAISWIAGQTKDAERKLDLMKIAGDVLPKAA